MKILTKSLFLSAALVLSACSISTGCDEYHQYRTTEAQTPVQVPADLEQPVNESTAPKATHSDASKVDRNAQGECLEKPPKL